MEEETFHLPLTWKTTVLSDVSMSTVERVL